MITLDHSRRERAAAMFASISHIANSDASSLPRVKSVMEYRSYFQGGGDAYDVIVRLNESEHR